MNLKNGGFFKETSVSVAEANHFRIKRYGADYARG
jgi:hypothetical protein